MKSIMSNRRECYLCGRKSQLHRHHIFFGNPGRRISEEEGCWVYLCGVHHNLGNNSVHKNRVLDLQLKETCERQWILVNNSTIDDFRIRFGKSYL